MSEPFEIATSTCESIQPASTSRCASTMIPRSFPRSSGQGAAVRAAGIALLAGILIFGSAVPAAATQTAIAGSKFELFVSDAAQSADFYSVLGFHVADSKPHGYTTLESGYTVVALSPLPWWLPVHWLGFLRLPPIGTELVFYVADLEGTRRRLDEAGHSPGPIELQSWGDRDFRVRDPDGYYIRISEGLAVPSDR